MAVELFFVTPPGQTPPVQLAFCEFNSADFGRCILRRTRDRGHVDFDFSLFPADEGFVFDPASTVPEHEQLGWVTMPTLAKSRPKT